MKTAHYTMQQTAKFIGIGPNKLFKLLRKRNVLNKENMPYQRFIDRGLLKVESGDWKHPTIGERIYGKTVVTAKGVNWLKQLIEEKQHA